VVAVSFPAFKLEKNIVSRRYELLLAAGVKFNLNTEIGKDILMDKIISSHDAVFIATGTYQPLSEPAINNDANIHTEALKYLEDVNQDLLNGNEVAFKKHIQDKKVVVLGGGDTTMDCIRTSIRLNAKLVTGVYRRDEKSMPGSKREFCNAKEEGSHFVFNAQPIGLVCKNEKLQAVKFVKTQLITNQDGKVSLEHLPGSEFEIEADVVITAFGFKPEQQDWLKPNQIDTDNHGRIKVSANKMQTANPKVFAGGDIVRGASLVVNAIADGMTAAKQIKQFLTT
jgi:glutamate synthase (NADPH/NADH) small chain